MRYFLSLLITFNFLLVTAQKSITISGTITDLQNGEQLAGVSVFDSLSNKGTLSNSYGFYSLSLKSGNIKLRYSAIGYKYESLSLKVNIDTALAISLKPSVTELQEVIVTEKRRQFIQPGVISMKTSQIRTAPVLMGEADLLKTIQLLPGIKSGTEGTSGLYVRGGSPDQNLIMLDGVPVYNSSHAFGFFSVFNPDAVSGFTFYKGGVPARYAGRLSSVLDIRMKEGNSKKITGKASLGLIASNFMLEGPVNGENTSFFVSGRRTFIDLLTKPFQAKDDPVFPNYFFHDINAKINHRFNDKNRLYLSVYSGKDHNGFSDKGSSQDNSSSYEYKDGFGWGNLTTSLRWNNVINKKMFSNITLVYSKYKFSIYNKSKEENHETALTSINSYNYFSGINDIGGRWDVDWFPSAKHSVKTGVNFTYHTFNPGITLVKNSGYEQSTDIDTTLGSRNYVREAYIYAEDEIKFTEKLSANIGLNYSVFSVGQKNYFSLQPRLALSYAVTKDLKVTSSYGIMSQYLHLLTNSTTGLPTDLWLPVTQKIKPQQAWQTALGIEYDLNSQYTLSVEGYYKQMSNLIEYKEGASFFKIKGSWEDKVEIGDGKSKGVEFLAQKEQGRTTGWIGVTLSKTTRQFANINNGAEYPYRYDRRLDIGILVMHKFSQKMSISCSWVFGTGNRITLPTEKIRTFYGDTTSYVKNITGINNFLTPAYHRLDASIDFYKRKSHWTRNWSFGAYNAYNRKNPFYIYADLLDKPPTLKQNSLFPILPYFKYSIVF
ncbi:MAG: TonB-dependent receptor [Methanosarcina sp.]